jgi:hypothetical protein
MERCRVELACMQNLEVHAVKLTVSGQTLIAHGLRLGDVRVVTETAGVVSLVACKYARYCRQ